jgi:GPH family glycoside/pentoside/hexuronide:cation symporter
MGVDARLIGWAVAIPRLWDAFLDPFIANASDNIHTRFGRRKPFILVGAFFAATFCILMWMPPTNMSKFSLFVYFFIISTFYYSSYSVFSIPYHAMGIELTSDYEDRTRLMSYKFFFMALGGTLFIPWAYKLCFVHAFGKNEVEGVRIVGIIIGILMVVFGTIPVFFSKERFAQVNREKISIIHAIKCTLKNRPFLMICLATLSACIGIFLVSPLGTYINLTYVFAGNKESVANITGACSTIYGIVTLVSIPGINYLSTHWGKKQTLQAGLLLAAFSFAISWFAYNPKMPYVQLIFTITNAPGMSCLWLLTSVMVADVCDLDELNTGLRREGMYTAAYAWIVKVSLAVVLGITGFVLTLTGFNPNLVTQTHETITKLRVLYMVVPIAFLLLAVYFIMQYPLDHKTMEGIQAQIKKTRIKKLNTESQL